MSLTLTASESLPWFDPCAPIVVPPRREDMIERILDNELMLVDPQSGATFRLNDTASFVWQACDSNTTLPSIIRQYSLTYNIDESQAADDVEQLVGFFACNGLLTTD